MLTMVVHRGSSWDSAASNSRATLQTLSTNTLPSPKTDTPCPKLIPDSHHHQKNSFSSRQAFLNNLSSGNRPSSHGSHSSHRHSLTPVHRARGRPVTSAPKSLDILRQNLQASINKEIDAVLKKYLETFFRPAIDNIRTNLGSSSVSEEHVREVCRAMLEEAKQMYSGRGSSPFSDGDTSDLIESRLRKTVAQSPLARKRKESSDTESERKRTARMSANKPEHARLPKGTLFILGSRANKVLGLGHVLGKSRLYIKHPHLFKYCADQQDQDWLAAHKHILVPGPSGSACLMLLDDVKQLAASDEYRNNPNVQCHELKGFEVPEFILRKIRNQMNNKNQKIEEPEPTVDLIPSICGLTIPNDISLECLASTLTPPSTILDSCPSTPSDALDLLDSPGFLDLSDDQDRSDTLSALLAGNPLQD